MNSSLKNYLPAVMAGAVAMTAVEVFLLPSGELGFFAAFVAALVAAMATLLAAFAAEVPVIGRHVLAFFSVATMVAIGWFAGVSFQIMLNIIWKLTQK